MSGKQGLKIMKVAIQFNKIIEFRPRAICKVATPTIACKVESKTSLYGHSTLGHINFVSCACS